MDSKKVQGKVVLVHKIFSVSVSAIVLSCHGCTFILCLVPSIKTFKVVLAGYAIQFHTSVLVLEKLFLTTNVEDLLWNKFHMYFFPFFFSSTPVDSCHELNFCLLFEHLG